MSPRRWIPTIAIQSLRPSEMARARRGHRARGGEADEWAGIVRQAARRRPNRRLREVLGGPVWSPGSDALLAGPGPSFCRVEVVAFPVKTSLADYLIAVRCHEWPVKVMKDLVVVGLL